MNNDAISIIISFLDTNNIMKCSLIDQRFNKIVNNENFWYRMCIRDYIDYYMLLKQNTFYETYMLCVDLDKVCLKFKTGLDIDNLYESDILNFQDSYIDEIPKEICRLTNLKYLYLSGNQITKIPKELCQLTNLRLLDLDDNYITSIPREIGQLVNIHELYLSNNRITSIPKEIGRLINVYELHLSHNPIINKSSVAEEIRQLIYLHKYGIQFNSVKDRFSIMEEICRLTNFICRLARQLFIN